MKNFNDMHNNAILEVFNFLDLKSLKTATEVCKKWNKIISENSPSLRELRKLKFVFRGGWKSVMAEMDRKTMLRLASTVVFSGWSDPDVCHYTEIDDEIIEILSTFHKHIRVLILDRVEIDVQTFKKLLSMFKLDKLILRRLHFTGTDLNNDNEAAVASDREPSNHQGKVLQWLGLAHPCKKTLNLLIEMKYQTTKLALNVDSTDADYYSFESAKSAFAQFITQQKSLKQFVVRCDHDSLSFFVEQLKSSKLMQLGIDSSNASADESLSEFIKSQPALKELEIISYRVSADTIKAIYETKDLQCLYLTMDTDHGIPTNLEFPNPCKPHAHLKKLKINHLNMETVKSFDVMMTMFANIEELQINYTCGSDRHILTNKIVLSAQKHLKSLQFLNIPRIADYFPAVSFKSLKKFHTASSTSWKILRSFLSHNPSLKELKIDHIFNYEVNADDASSPEELSALRILESLMNKFVINEEIFQELKESCPQLQKFIISKDQRILIDQTVADSSRIEIYESDQSRSDSFDASTQSLFKRTKDADMHCIWNSDQDDNLIDGNDIFEELEIDDWFDNEDEVEDEL